MPEKPLPVIKQIENTALNAAIILVMGPFAVLAMHYMAGSINVRSPQAWQEIYETLKEGAVVSFLLACAWVTMKSPIGKTFRTLVASVREEDGVRQELSVNLDQPAIPANQTRTTEIDPKTQTVTITESPSIESEKKEVKP